MLPKFENLQENFKINCNDLQEKDIPNLSYLLNILSPKKFQDKKLNFEDFNYWKKIMNNSYVFTVRDTATNSEDLVGMITLVPMYQPFGFFGSVQDVVVSDKYRGKGLGDALINQLLYEAKKLRIEGLNLTCSREHLHQWYQKLGFEEYSTTYFKKSL